MSDIATLEQPQASTPQVDILETLIARPAYKLTIDNVSGLILKGYNQAQIAKILNVSRQAVDQYIDRHSDTIRPLVDNTDAILAIRFKRQAINYIDSIDDSAIQKASLLQRVTAAGIATDKYRLLSGQSTENISLRVSDAERSDIEQIAREAALKVMRAQDIVVEAVIEVDNE